METHYAWVTVNSTTSITTWWSSLYTSYTTWNAGSAAFYATAYTVVFVYLNPVVWA